MSGQLQTGCVVIHVQSTSVYAGSGQHLVSMLPAAEARQCHPSCEPNHSCGATVEVGRGSNFMFDKETKTGTKVLKNIKEKDEFYPPEWKGLGIYP